jgi:hypothetical protein
MAKKYEAQKRRPKSPSLYVLLPESRLNTFGRPYTLSTKMDIEYEYRVAYSVSTYLYQY